MVIPINPIRPPAPVAAPDLGGASKSAGGAAFGAALTEAMGRVQALQDTSKNSIQRFLSGEDEEVHRVALAAQEAQGAFDLFLQVRNKAVQAYQEIMRMQM